MHNLILDILILCRSRRYSFWRNVKLLSSWGPTLVGPEGEKFWFLGLTDAWKMTFKGFPHWLIRYRFSSFYWKYETNFDWIKHFNMRCPKKHGSNHKSTWANLIKLVNHVLILIFYILLLRYWHVFEYEIYIYSKSFISYIQITELATITFKLPSMIEFHLLMIQRLKSKLGEI